MGVPAYGINTIAINEDTPNDQKLWEVSVVWFKSVSLSALGNPLGLLPTSSCLARATWNI